MLELSTLGRLDIRDSGGQPIAELCTRPKTLALLVYLALARPRGFHAQDVLLATFWPEADTARAQSSLRQSLHLLRRFLGEGVVVRRGRAQIGIELSRVRCDALLFDEAIDDGQLEQALGFYGGDLLPGFHVFDAPEFERWLDSERRWRREAAIKAARDLTQRARCSAEPSATCAAALRWLALAGNDVQALEQAIDALVATGEHAAAARVYDDFVAARDADDDAPSATTKQMADNARARLAQQAASIVVTPVVEEPSRAEPSAPAMPAPTVVSASLAPAERPIRQRRVMLAFAAAAVFALTIVGNGSWNPLASAPRTPTDAERASASRIAIMPFEVRGGRRLDYLREGMVDLLSAKLDGTGGLSTVEPRAVLADARSHGDDIVGPDRAQLVARQFEARQFVLGSVIDVGGRIEIAATLYSADGTRRATVSGSAADESHVLAAVDKVARELLMAQFADATAHMERVAAMTTTSMPALKAFLEGEHAMRNGQTASAVDAFQHAIRDDSTFALAYYRLSTSAHWSDDPTVVQHAVQSAMRYADGLPQHEHLALAARSAVDHGDADGADRQYRDLVARYPTDADAWTQLGELQFHLGPWRGMPISESRIAFERVIGLKPDDVNALLHLTRLAALDGRIADVLALSQRALVVPTDRATSLELRGLQSTTTNDQRERESVLAALRSTAAGGDDDAHLVAWRVATFSDDPNEGDVLVSPLLEASTPASLRVPGRAALVHMNASRGQWQSALRMLVMIDHDDPGMAAELRANIAVSRPQVLSPFERLQARRVLSESSSPTPADPLRAARRTYLLGTLALADDDVRAVSQSEKQLSALSERDDADGDLAVHLLHQLKARVLWKQGDAASALHEVEAGWPKGTARLSLPLYQGEGYSHAHERFLRGTLLAALRRDTEATRWFGSVVEDQGASLLLSAPVHLARARLAERTDSAAALTHYQQALKLWAHADAAGGSDLEAARRFVARATGVPLAQ